MGNNSNETVTRGQRFLVNGNNTVTDQLTGLVIIQDPRKLGLPFTKKMTFFEAEEACKELDFAGYKDWRLPTREELVATTDCTRRVPCYNTDIFQGDFLGWYWTGEEGAKDLLFAWCLAAGSGDLWCHRKSESNYVRPVRSNRHSMESWFVK